MCQLLGLNCATPTDANFSFTGFRRRGGATDHHADGWGIAFFEGKGLRLFVDHGSARESLRELALYSSDVEEIVADAHVPRLEIVKFGFLTKLRVMAWSQAAGSNLRDVGMGACHSLTHVTWVQHLPCLESLTLSGCRVEDQ